MAPATTTLVTIASSVWRQYFPEESDIYVAAPHEDESKTQLVEEKDGRFEAALNFRNCFQDPNVWAPLLYHCDLTQKDLTTVWLNHAEMASKMPDFANVLEEFPLDVIPCLGLALCMVRHEKRQDLEETPARKRSVTLDQNKIQVRLHNVSPVLPVASLKADVVNRFVTVMGTVVRVSAIKPLVTRCDFVCVKCNEVTSRAFPDGKYNPPSKCEHSSCRSKTLLPNRSTVETVDYQKIK
jgi:DNA replicative helicase MCM subunit Mcm2 (Cdc46/Mcm family)